MKKPIVYLVGFMGSGKTSVGMSLARLLHWRFMDLDQLIEKREGQPVREIFRRKGEMYFRKLEREELEAVSAQTSAVVALGGGTFCNDMNRRVVESTGESVWLDAPMEILYNRCAGDQSRPLFTSRHEMERLLESRRPCYEMARIRVSVGVLTVDELAQKILRMLEAL